MSPLFLPVPCLGQAHVCQGGRRAGQVTLRLSGGQGVSQIPFLPGRNWGSTSRSRRPVTAADFLVGRGPSVQAALQLPAACLPNLLQTDEIPRGGSR